MSARRAARGQPLVALVVILTGWVGARVAIVGNSAEEPAHPVLAPSPIQRGIDLNAAKPRAAASPAAETARQEQGAAPSQPLLPARRDPVPLAPRWSDPAPLAPSPAPLAAPGVAAPVKPAGMPVRVAAGHQLLWMAALADLPLPAEIASPATWHAPELPAALKLPRWSADGWLLWRRGGNGISTGGFAPSAYGASQAGAVVRYRLAPDSAYRPALYLRATTALQDPRGEEVAFGLAARPIPGLPIAAMVEARATRFAGGTKVRPAAALVTELPPFALPLKARGELYVQTGYVGGPGATAFVDGSLKLDRALVKLGKAELRAGGGAWGGAQDGAARLDLGPSLTLGMPHARLAMDWRFRVAGAAAPRSGPAVTLSAGF